MHTYSTDNDKRVVIYGFLGFVAYILVLGIGRVTSLLGSGLSISIEGTISWGLAFTILSTVFIRYGWKTAFARSTGVSKVPDFSGEWEGYIKTSYDGHIEKEVLHESNDSDDEMQRIAAQLHINQTWRKINIYLSTKHSESDSTGATILTKKGRWPSLTYQYENDPDVDTDDTMRSHDGTADLSLKQEGDDDILDGFYYTGPGRENYGEMFFERTS